MGRLSRFIQASQTAHTPQVELPPEQMLEIIQEHPALAVVVERWPSLPPRVRKALLTLIEMANKNGEARPAENGDSPFHLLQ